MATKKVGYLFWERSQKWSRFEACKEEALKAYFMYAAQAEDAANEEGGLFVLGAVTKMVQIRGVQGGGAEAYFMYAAQAEDAANEEGGLFL